MRPASSQLSALLREPTAPIKIGMLVGSASPRAGGVFEALRSLSRALHRPPRCMTEVFALSDTSAAVDATAFGSVPLNVLKTRGPSAFGYSGGLVSAIRDSKVDLLHVHGLWMYISVAARSWALQTRGIYVVSPHGMLDPWALANSRWKKEIARHLYENDHLRGAGCIHVLCEAELNAVRAFGLRNPVCVIPNGVDVEPHRELAPPEWRSLFPANAKILLFLGRLTPKKGLVSLIRAWSLAESREGEGARNWRLAIAGWGPDPYVRDLKELVWSLGLQESIRFIGPQFGADKTATLKAVDAFVLPSISEGLPMAALEAWAQGLPTLLTPQCNLPEGFVSGAAMCISHEADGLAGDLAELFRMSPLRLRLMGWAGQRLVAERFIWGTAAAGIEAVYRWLLNMRERPASVHLA